MLKSKLEAFWFVFTDIFNTKDDDAKGRLVYLSCVLFSAFYNVFITGIFYTGFLSMYDISITGVGIVSFIPSIANVFTVFSSRVLSRFKRRKNGAAGGKGALLCHQDRRHHHHAPVRA